MPTSCCQVELRLAGDERLIEVCNMTPADYAYGFEDLRIRLERIATREGLPADCIADLAAFSSDPVAYGVGTAEPGMEAGPRDLQNLAEPADRPDVAVFGDEGESHIASRAKKAAAFFRMSRSARSRATSFFKAAISDRSARICPFPGNAAAGLRSVPASSGAARSAQHRDHGPPALPQRHGPLPA